MATYTPVRAPQAVRRNNVQSRSRLIVKPSFDHGGGGIVANQSGQYTIFDPEGNQLEQIRAGGRPGEHGIKVQSQAIHSGLPSGSYIVGPDGTRYNLTGGSGQRHEFDEGNSKPIVVSNKGAVRGGGGGSYGGDFSSGGPQTSVYTTAGGNNVVIPGGADFGSVMFNPADWYGAYGDARMAGDEAKDLYMQNIQDARNPALDLVDTDIEGIKRGINELAPIYRREGDTDAQTNMRRAGELDSFNFTRIPGFNNFNRDEVGKTNDFNASQFEEAVGRSGVDYRDRVNTVLDQLKAEAAGGFSDEFLNNVSSQIARGRGSDIAASSGVNPFSGAGSNILAMTDANTRIDRAMQAQSLIPSVAGQAQQLLQPPLELSKTTLATPTEVPLSTSDVASRVPLQPNISAGSTAMHIADTAESYQAVGAPQALASSLQNRQFNSQMQFERDKFVSSMQNSQILGQANALQGGFNADKADQVRGEQQAAFQQGLDTASTNQALGAGASVIGTIGGILASQNGGAGEGSGGPSTVGAGNAGVGDGSGVSIQTPYPVSSGGVAGSAPSVMGNDAPSIGGDSGATTIDPVTGQYSTPSVDQSTYQIPADPQVSSGGVSSGVLSAPYSPSSSPTYGPTGLSGSDAGGYSSSPSISTPSVSYSPPSDTDIGGFEPDSGDYADIGMTSFKSADVMRVGDKQVSASDYSDTVRAAGSAFGKPSLSGTSNNFLPATGTDSQGRPAPSESNPANITPDTGLKGAYKEVSSALADVGLDASMLATGVQVIAGWKSLPPAQRLAAVGQIGVTALKNKGLLNPNEAKTVEAVGAALAAIANPDSSGSDRSAQSGSLLANLGMRTFTGSVVAPTTVRGQAVMGSYKDGTKSVFKLADGTAVHQDALQAGLDTKAALGAYQVLVGTASDEKKAAALSAAGVSPIMANRLIKNVKEGNPLAALSLFNSAVPWEHQTEIQKSATIMQTAGTVHGAVAGALPSNYKNKSNSGDKILKGLSVNNGGSYSTDVAGQNVTVDSSGVNVNTNIAGQDVSFNQTGLVINGSAGGHDVKVNPVSMQGSVDFYGVPVSLNPSKAPISGPVQGASVSDNKGSGVSIGPKGASAHTTASVGGNAHVGVSASVSPSGSFSAAPTAQIGNSAGSAAGAQVGSAAGSAAGNAIAGPVGGAVGSFLGSLTGSVIGNFFSGTSGQDMRNGWRKGLVSSGLATKGPQGAVNITLADGSNYDIGKDGGFKLKNSDGTDRFTYEVDWTNPVAADSIPVAQLVNIASGIDPSVTKKDTFNRATGQMTNAITSNASSVQDSYNNAKSILESKNISPQSLGMRVEALRVSNKISDQEYGVYLNELNNVYGTSFKPVDRATATQSFVSMFKDRKDLSKADKEFYNSLTDEKTLKSNLDKTNKRIEGRKVSATGGLIAPERYGSYSYGSPKDEFMQAA